MPLHEYLEKKRRQNITQLNATGACHICGSTCRNSEGFNHFLDNENNDATAAAVEKGGNYNENSMVRPPNLAAMRTCSCFGIAPSDPDYWPYSLRVCDRCIQDDKGIGRIRNCGICGTVACDENCGGELLECTDCAEWNNAGCLECRNMGDFSEMDIFRGTAPKTSHGEQRCTRICKKCLEQSTPWVKYDFVCRRFKCETRLVPSDIAERKRFCTFGSSPLNLLPEDGLVAIVDFLSGSDLKQLFLTCSAMCTVAERVAMQKVESVNNGYPTGPIATTKRKDQHGSMKDTPYLEGKNDFGLRAPDDDKSWVGVYHHLENLTREMYYFGFQIGADKEVVGKFINQTSDTKFAFGRAYSTVENNLVESPIVGMSVRGGCVLVTGELGDNISPSPLVIASSQRLETGIHRAIFRLFCPGMGTRSNRNAQTYKLGSIGILCTNQRGEGPTNSWAQRQDIMEGYVREDIVFGIEYNADERELVIHANSHLSRSSTFVSNTYTVAETEAPGDLFIAAELTSKSANTVQSLLTVRNCDAEEWAQFIAHTTEGNPRYAGAQFPNILDPMAADDDVEGGIMEPHPPAIREALRNRQALRNRRRERAADDDVDGGIFHRIQVRAMEAGRRIPQMLLLPRGIAPAEGNEEVVEVADGGGGMDLEEPPAANNNEGQQRPGPRRVVRAVRPVVRAAAMAEQVHIDSDDEFDNQIDEMIDAEAFLEDWQP